MVGLDRVWTPSLKNPTSGLPPIPRRYGRISYGKRQCTPFVWNPRILP